jgi:hypothetical protein
MPVDYFGTGRDAGAYREKEGYSPAGLRAALHHVRSVMLIHGSTIH